MAKKILAAANNKEQKYFMEEEFKFLPDTIKEDLKRICVYMAEKLNCTFLVGFDDNGDVYFETIKHEGDFDFDEIGAELEIKRLQKEELSEAAFFDRNRLPPLPPPLSLARCMIDWWLDCPSSR